MGKRLPKFMAPIEKAEADAVREYDAVREMVINDLPDEAVVLLVNRVNWGALQEDKKHQAGPRDSLTKIAERRKKARSGAKGLLRAIQKA